MLSDDGLQHLALARDLELAVVDQRLWGNGWLLPAGPLRETSGRRRDATVGPPVALRQLTDNAPRFVVQRAPGDIAHLTNGERLSVDAFRQRFAGQPLGAIAGIGHPGQFFAMLRTPGLSVQGVAVADHRSFPADALDAFPPGAPVLITEKDAIKSTHLPPALRERLWVVGLRLDLPAELLPWLTHQLEIARGRSTA
ncbi:tetraacyldisaccharide 4'-kinase [mine drainage metagenome]|uniref:tetraacyldisaccharide 4'-kinase n=1 Tax=mine drainage metagenome TaxID=410659 RepID=A0A1J5PDQ0_9ZZZZ